MSSITGPTNIDALTDLILAERDRSREFSKNSGTMLFCVRIPLENFDSLRWLKALTQYPRVYWSDREQSLEFAGIGNVYTVEDSRSSFTDQLDEVQALLACSNAGDIARAFAAGAFSENIGRDQTWSDFPEHCVVIPELAVLRTADAVTALLSVILEDETTLETALPRLLKLAQLLEVSAETEESDIHLESRIDLPAKEDWEHAVTTATDAISNGQIDKVVLARRTDFSMANRPDPADLLARLAHSNPHCYRILYAPKPETAFICVSPERLFRCQGQRLSTEAVAGTISRGQSEIEDLALENRLRNSAKDRAEQDFVIAGITNSLEPLCEKIEVSAAASVMKLSRIQHLISEFRSILNPDATIGKVYEALHPTAAVCGTPRIESLRVLTELEQFERGWYAGGIGVVSAENTELSVGIRSLLVRDKMLSVFTGAGIVKQSKPSEEWLEIEEKLQSIVHAIDGKCQ